jgi:hypothetical protein
MITPAVDSSVATGYLTGVEAEYHQVLREAEENRQYWEERNREHLEAMRALPPTPEQAAIRAKIADHKKKLGPL